MEDSGHTVPPAYMLNAGKFREHFDDLQSLTVSAEAAFRPKTDTKTGKPLKTIETISLEAFCIRDTECRPGTPSLPKPSEYKFAELDAWMQHKQRFTPDYHVLWFYPEEGPQRQIVDQESFRRLLEDIENNTVTLKDQQMRFVMDLHREGDEVPAPLSMVKKPETEGSEISGADLMAMVLEDGPGPEDMSETQLEEEEEAQETDITDVLETTSTSNEHDTSMQTSLTTPENDTVETESRPTSHEDDTIDIEVDLRDRPEEDTISVDVDVRSRLENSDDVMSVETVDMRSVDLNTNSDYTQNGSYGSDEVYENYETEIYGYQEGLFIQRMVAGAEKIRKTYSRRQVRFSMEVLAGMGNMAKLPLTPAAMALLATEEEADDKEVEDHGAQLEMLWEAWCLIFGRPSEEEWLYAWHVMETIFSGDPAPTDAEVEQVCDDIRAGMLSPIYEQTEPSETSRSRRLSAQGRGQTSTHSGARTPSSKYGSPSKIAASRSPLPKRADGDLQRKPAVRRQPVPESAVSRTPAASDRQRAAEAKQPPRPSAPAPPVTPPPRRATAVAQKAQAPGVPARTITISRKPMPPPKGATAGPAPATKSRTPMVTSRRGPSSLGLSAPAFAPALRRRPAMNLKSEPASARAKAVPERPEEPVDLSATLARFEAGEVLNADYEDDGCAVVDATLGSIGACDNERLWRECLDFFLFDVNDYLARTEGLNGAPATAHPKKRAPIRPLWGLRVSLFDYQLMGVFLLLRRNVLQSDCHGGFLADAMGLGKTVEIFAALAVAAGLRKLLAEVKGRTGKHCKPGAGPNDSCPREKKYGVRCPCHSPVARRLAEALPDGLNLLLAPAKTCNQLFEQAKAKLDTRIFKVRMEGPNAKVADRLQSSELGGARAKITCTGMLGADGSTDNLGAKYTGLPGQDELVLIAPHTALGALDSQLSHLVKMRQVGKSGEFNCKMGGLMPGIVFLDEFHEYAHCSRSWKGVDWLWGRVRAAANPSAPPLVYFLSGTPTETSPADLVPALSILEKARWVEATRQVPQGPRGPLRAEMDNLITRFETLMVRQEAGEVVPQDQVHRYRNDLWHKLSPVMVRRQATDKFRGRPITDLGPMQVRVHNLLVPTEYKADLQALAHSAEAEVVGLVAGGHADSVPALLASPTAAELPTIQALRLASAFPAMAAAIRSAGPAAFTQAALEKELAAAAFDTRRTRFWTNVRTWTRGAPKAAALLQVVRTMLADNAPVAETASRAKKLCIFAASEPEAVLLHAFLLHIKDATSGDKLDKRIKPVLMCTGMPSAAREAALASFRREDNSAANILIASMSRAGTGLDFPCAKYCVVTGLGWRKSDSAQAFARTHRVGQKQRTQLHLLVARGEPLERRLFDRQSGMVVEEGEGAWRVYGEGEDVPGGGADGEGLVRGNVKVEHR